MLQKLVRHAGLPKPEYGSLGEHHEKRILNISQIVDTPPIQVKAQPWTTVTTDDTLVSHIHSAWMM